MSEPTYLEKHCRHFEEDKEHPLNQGCAVTGYVFSGEHPVNNCKHFELKPEILRTLIEEKDLRIQQLESEWENEHLPYIAELEARINNVQLAARTIAMSEDPEERATAMNFLLRINQIDAESK